MLGVTQGPLSLVVEYWMLCTVKSLSPLLLMREDWVTPSACCPATILKETVLGAIASRGLAEFEVPFRVMGVDPEYLATLLVVLTRISLDSKPTVLGAKVALTLKV